MKTHYWSIKHPNGIEVTIEPLLWGDAYLAMYDDKELVQAKKLIKHELIEQTMKVIETVIGNGTRVKWQKVEL